MEHQEKASKKGGIVFCQMTNLENIFFAFLRGGVLPLNQKSNFGNTKKASKRRPRFVHEICKIRFMMI